MQNYVVIELKSKEEKVKVLNFLAAETEAEYKVTSDLKKFVSEKYNVTIVDNATTRAPTLPQNGESANIGDYFPTFDYPKYTVNDWNMSNSPTPTTSDISQPSVVKVENNSSYPDYVENMPAHDDHQLSNGEKLPIHEDIDDEQDQKDNAINFLDGNYYELEDKERERTPTVESSRSPSNAPKRPATEEHEMSTQQKKRKSKEEECKTCGFVGVFDSYVAKYRHVVTHTGVKSYGCFVEGCSFRHKHRITMVRHMKKYHKTQLTCFGLVQLSREENEEVEQTMRESFPLTDPNSKDHCRTCNVRVGGDGFNKRRHAQNHVDFMIYKCVEPECQFTGKTMASMQTHRRAHPGVANPQVGQLPLTGEQRKEIESTFLKCFPEFQTNGRDNN